MKICQYLRKTPFGVNGRLGILLEDDTIIDPNLVWRADFENEGYYYAEDRADHKLPPSLHDLLKFSDNPIDLLQDTWGLWLFYQKRGILQTKNGAELSFPLNDNDIFLGRPIDKIPAYRDFFAHEKHIKAVYSKRGEEVPEIWKKAPAYFNGDTKGFMGSEKNIPWPSFTRKLDYELELGMVVGKAGKNINEDGALSHIFGFTILNDISARDVQKQEVILGMGPAKSKDFCTVIGPVITTIDEFEGKEPDLLMTAKVNGDEWSRGQSGDSFYSFSQMITHVSRDEWILPGDIFGGGAIGTGCGFEQGKWIQPGDTLELTVEKIGSLKNKIDLPEDKEPWKNKG